MSVLNTVSVFPDGRTEDGEDWYFTFSIGDKGVEILVAIRGQNNYERFFIPLDVAFMRDFLTPPPKTQR